MNAIVGFLSIKREERLPVGLFFVWQLLLQTVAIAKYMPLFAEPSGNYYKQFVDNYHLSGFDPLTYLVVSDWSLVYDVNRHPLLAFFYYPFSLLNQLLIHATGINFSVYIVAAVLIFFSTYGFVLMLRIQRHIIGIASFDSAILAFILYSFAHVLLSSIAPDHFILSLFMLLLTLYIAGKQLKEQKEMSIWQTVLLFMLTAGISLNNGLKVFLCNFFTRGKRFFTIKNIFLAIILPAAAIFAIGEWQHEQFIADKVKASKVKKRNAIRAERKAMFAAFKDTTHIKDSTKQEQTFQKMWKAHRKEVLRAEAKQPQKAHSGKPVSNKRFLNWTDVSTSRTETIVENLFGESIQLHQKHTLKDVMTTRPVIVAYDWIVNYVVEALIFLLFIVGIWCGRHSKFLWLCLSFAALDIVLHIGLGFGINEVYIMTAHWIYVIPLSIAFFVRNTCGRTRQTLRTLFVLLAIYLAVYNVSLLVRYLYF
ncbi:DUF6080 domain-containing protein [Prevotella falsenii]|uniref:DUF6080 domain-containing protein n=1 Tax=Prevotella falsenii TaxID=515414 RepID=UPI00046A6CD7|nr:DUF6080 domain-containing protein [Prevotella falsenii]